LQILLGRTLHSVSALLPPSGRPFRPSQTSFFSFLVGFCYVTTLI
jgi:hypothetical protein